MSNLPDADKRGQSLRKARLQLFTRGRFVRLLAGSFFTVNGECLLAIGGGLFIYRSARFFHGGLGLGVRNFQFPGKLPVFGNAMQKNADCLICAYLPSSCCAFSTSASITWKAAASTDWRGRLGLLSATRDGEVR